LSYYWIGEGTGGLCIPGSVKKKLSGYMNKKEQRLKAIRELEIIVVEDKMDGNLSGLVTDVLNKSKIMNPVVQLENAEMACAYISGVRRGEGGETAVGLVVLNSKPVQEGGGTAVEQLKSASAGHPVAAILITPVQEVKLTESSLTKEPGLETVSVLNFSSFSKAVTKLGFYWLLLAPPAVQKEA
jgi:hypothetical protein